MFEYTCIAVADLARSVSDYSDRSKTLSGNYYLFIVVGFIILFWVGLLFKDKILSLFAPSKPTSKTLFSDLCEYHKLNRSEKKWLKELATLNKTDQHAIVFVKPEWFTGGKLPNGSAKTAQKMLMKLFGKEWLKTTSD